MCVGRRAGIVQVAVSRPHSEVRTVTTNAGPNLHCLDYSVFSVRSHVPGTVRYNVDIAIAMHACVRGRCGQVGPSLRQFT